MKNAAELASCRRRWYWRSNAVRVAGYHWEVILPRLCPAKSQFQMSDVEITRSAASCR